MRLALPLAVLVLAVVPASAHHSFAAEYQENTSITLDAKVTEFLFRNPHCLFTVETTDASGITTRWVAEWGGAGRVGPEGVTAETFKPGDHVIITGAPAINPVDHKIHVKAIVRPSDGLKFDGSPGAGRDPFNRLLIGPARRGAGAASGRFRLLLVMILPCPRIHLGTSCEFTSAKSAFFGHGVMAIPDKIDDAVIETRSLPR